MEGLDGQIKSLAHSEKIGWSAHHFTSHAARRRIPQLNTGHCRGCYKTKNLLPLCGVSTACISKPLGMEDGTIAENKITASSTHDKVGRLTWGRLHCSQGSWAPNTDDSNQWFQVDFSPDVKLISHIATQGNGKNWWWVKTYYVTYRTGGATFQEYKENNQRVVSKIPTTAFILTRKSLKQYACLEVALKST